MKGTAEKIFYIVKNYSKLNSNPKLNLSERMRMKKEKFKFIIGDKNRRMIGQEDTINPKSITTEKNVEINLNKLRKPSLERKLDKLKKKEIKIIRNRISAQKSRAKQKMELSELRNSTNNLSQENNSLKSKLKEKEDELSFISSVIKYCSNCSTILYDEENMKLSYSPNNYEEIINTKRNKSLRVIENSSATENNLNSSRIKLGLLSGMFLFVFLIGCIALFPFNQEKQNDNFFSGPENLRNLYILEDKSKSLRNHSQLITENDVNRRDDLKRKLLDLEESTKLAIYPLGNEIKYESIQKQLPRMEPNDVSESINTKFMK